MDLLGRPETDRMSELGILVSQFVLTLLPVCSTLRSMQPHLMPMACIEHVNSQGTSLSLSFT